MNEVADRIDKFIERYFDLEIIVSPEARSHLTVGKLYYSDVLGNAIASYIDRRSTGQRPTEQEVGDCFAVITKAYANGFLKEGSDLLRKLDDCRKQNIQLMKDLATCMANYTALQIEHERLLKMLDQNQTEEWKTGEEKSNETT